MKFAGVFWGAGAVTAKTGTRKPLVYSCTKRSMLFAFREICEEGKGSWAGASLVHDFKWSPEYWAWWCVSVTLDPGRGIMN